MKVIVKIHQMEQYTSREIGEASRRNDIVLNAENLVDAVAFIQKMPDVKAVNIHVNVEDYDKRKSTEEESDS